jgi:hypothetical protein
MLDERGVGCEVVVKIQRGEGLFTTTDLETTNKSNP